MPDRGSQRTAGERGAVGRFVDPRDRPTRTASSPRACVCTDQDLTTRRFLMSHATQLSPAEEGPLVPDPGFRPAGGHCDLAPCRESPARSRHRSRCRPGRSDGPRQGAPAHPGRCPGLQHNLSDTGSHRPRSRHHGTETVRRGSRAARHARPRHADGRIPTRSLPAPRSWSAAFMPSRRIASW